MGVSSQQHATKNFSRLWWDVRIILRGKLQILSTWRRYSTIRYCSEKIQETIIWFLIYLTKYSQLNGLEYTILSNERIFVNDSGRNWRKVLAYYSALISEYFRGEDLRKNKKHFSLSFDTPAWNCNKIYFSRDKPRRSWFSCRQMRANLLSTFHFAMNGTKCVERNGIMKHLRCCQNNLEAASGHIAACVVGRLLRPVLISTSESKVQLLLLTRVHYNRFTVFQRRDIRKNSIFCSMPVS